MINIGALGRGPSAGRNPVENGETSGQPGQFRTDTFFSPSSLYVGRHATRGRVHHAYQQSRQNQKEKSGDGCRRPKQGKGDTQKIAKAEQNRAENQKNT